MACKAKTATIFHSRFSPNKWRKKNEAALKSALPTGSKDAAKAGLARHSPTVKASPSAAKTNNASSKDKPASERGPDLKKPLRSAAKPDAAAAKGEKAAGKGDSRSQAVVEKQAGRKRRSRSGERSRSPKRKATSPAARNSGGATASLLCCICSGLVALRIATHSSVNWLAHSRAEVLLCAPMHHVKVCGISP